VIQRRGDALKRAPTLDLTIMRLGFDSHTLPQKTITFHTEDKAIR